MASIIKELSLNKLDVSKRHSLINDIRSDELLNDALKNRSVSTTNMELVLTNDNDSDQRNTMVTKLKSSSTTISDKHYDYLINELQCPECFKPMCAPIRLCESGHSVCNGCIKISSKCPLCSRPFTNTRSITLETIAAKAYFNCPNAEHGCKIRWPLAKMSAHKKKCVYNKSQCFMGKVWGDCLWQGFEIDWPQHCADMHGNRVFDSPDVNIEWIYNFWIDGKESKPIVGYYIFHVFQQTFNLYQIFDRRKGRITWTILCSTKDASIPIRYAFEIELYSPTRPHIKLLHRYPCHSELDEFVLEEGHCVMINLSEAKKFFDMNSKKLNYRVRILNMPILLPNTSSKTPSLLSEPIGDDAEHSSQIIRKSISLENLSSSNWIKNVLKNSNPVLENKLNQSVELRASSFQSDQLKNNQLTSATTLISSNSSSYLCP